MTLGTKTSFERPPSRRSCRRPTSYGSERQESEKLLRDEESSVGGSNRKYTVLESHGYTVGKIIGTGSYATVKLARSTRHGGDVAIKIVSKIQAPQDYLKKFLPREIEVVRGLKHPNLIRFLQAIETTHRVYIIMEFAENGSLFDMIRNQGSVEETRARHWFMQLLSALQYCHERGVVHRDIKCENLLLDSGYNIKLSDFGFARAHMRCRSNLADNTLSETFCGSYAYASPEILQGIPYAPHMSDIWSMGVVLFAMVYGRLPFDDSSVNELLKQVQEDVAFPKQPDVSTVCRNLISNILSSVENRPRLRSIAKHPWVKPKSRAKNIDKEYHQYMDMLQTSATCTSTDEY